MARPDKKRIAVEADARPLQSLAAALPELDSDRLLPASDAPAASESPAPRKMGRVVLRKEKAGRGGKTVIVLDGFATHLHPLEIEAIGKELRRTCGCGGVVKGRSIELQGEDVAKIRKALETHGFHVAGVRE